MEEPIAWLMLDDDRLALHHFCRLADWGALGFAQPVCCTSFLQARMEMERTRFSVYVLDIEMPGGNGLDFASEIRERDHNAILLMLTAYREFRYAREALSIGAFDYLIKHEMTATTFVDKLLEIRERLENREHHRLLMLRTSLCLLLSEETQPKQTRSCIELLEIGREPMALMHVRPPFSFSILTRRESPQALEVSEDDFADMGILACSEGNGIWALLRADDRIALSEQLRAAIEMLTSRLRTSEFSYSDPFTGAEQALVWKRYFTREEENRFFENLHCVKRLISPCELGENTAPPDLRRLDDAWRQNDPLVAEDALRRVMEQVKRLKDRVEVLRRACAHWLERCCHPLASADFTDIDALIKQLSLSFAQTVDRRLKLDAVSPVTRDVVDYIDCHPTASMTELAEALKRSEGYLRTNFKRDMNQTIADYALQQRIERAKRLLAQRPVKIADIAQTLHYQSTQYFSAVFRKATGLTPMEYARQCTKEDRL